MESENQEQSQLEDVDLEEQERQVAKLLNPS